MFSKNKKEILGTFEDDKGINYELVRERQRRLLDKKGEGFEEIIFYREGEYVPSWEVSKIKLDLSTSNKEVIDCFIKEYLQSSSNIRTALTYMKFPMEGLLTIWNGTHKDNSLIKETLLAYQNILSDYDFVEGLIHQEKWLLFTQNIYRTNENMKAYENMYREVIADFLSKYLSSKYIEKYERVYGEWKELVIKTFSEFFSDDLKEQAVQEAILKTKKDLSEYENKKLVIKENLNQLDKEYEKAPISQKFKIEEEVKSILKTEEQNNEDIKETIEKIARIESFLQ
jgi:hypothetical protein